MCFDRYWSHIQDFQDFIRRFFGMFGPCLSNIDKLLEIQNVEICKNNMFNDASIFLVFVEALLYKKGTEGARFGKHSGSSKNDPKCIGICL